MGSKDSDFGKRVTILPSAAEFSPAGDLFLNGMSGVPSGIVDTFRRLALKMPRGGRLVILKDGIVDADFPKTSSSFRMMLRGEPVIEFISESGGVSADIEVTSELSMIKSPHEIPLKFCSLFEKDMDFIRKDSSFTPDKKTGSGGTAYIHQEAVVSGSAFLDVSRGDVVVDKGAVIGPFSLIEGPAYAGAFCRIDQARIRRGTHVGAFCRISGEVEASVISPYSNKHHDGFLGHSVLGRWTNLGAMTTNSDLKNNYSTIRVPDIEGRMVDTSEIKVGVILGDHVKTGIGTLMKAGSRIGMGTSLYGGGLAPVFIPPFSWTDGISLKDYDMEKFLVTAAEVMRRRGVAMDARYREDIKRIFDKTAKRREQVRIQWAN